MRYLIVFALLLASAAVTNAQEKNEASAQQLIESKNFVFKAETVTPTRGRFRQLTSEYDLVVAVDTVTAFLPYFGRAFSAPINPSEGGIKFTSSKFEFGTEKRKKDGWEIIITPKDAQDVQTLYLTVFENKRAQLRVNSLNRESITFNGYIKEGKPKNKKAF